MFGHSLSLCYSACLAWTKYPSTGEVKLVFLWRSTSPSSSGVTAVEALSPCRRALCAAATKFSTGLESARELAAGRLRTLPLAANSNVMTNTAGTASTFAPNLRCNIFSCRYARSKHKSILKVLRVGLPTYDVKDGITKRLHSLRVGQYCTCTNALDKRPRVPTHRTPRYALFRREPKWSRL